MIFFNILRVYERWLYYANRTMVCEYYCMKPIQITIQVVYEQMVAIYRNKYILSVPRKSDAYWWLV